MREDLRELLSQFYERKSGDGKKVSKILKQFSLDEVYDELKEMLLSIHDKNFEWALFFVNYVYCCADYIPGKNDEALSKKILEADLVWEIVEYLADKKAYYRLNVVFQLLYGLPSSVTNEKIQTLVKKYEKENPVMVAPLMVLFAQMNDYSFPKDLYDSLNFADCPGVGFVSRYAILQNPYLDSFDKVDYLKKMCDICPENFKADLESRIKECEALLSEDYDYQQSEDCDDRIMDLVLDYFDECQKIYEDGKSLSFADFCSDKIL